MTLRSAARFRTLLTIMMAGSLLLMSHRFCLAQTQTPPNPEKIRPTSPFVDEMKKLLEKQDFDAVIQACSKALEGNAKNGSAFLYRGIAYNGKADYDKAIADFDKVAEIGGRDPVLLWNRADAYSNRSTSYRLKGEPLKAIDSAYFSLLEKYENPEAHMNRGLAYIDRHSFDRAVQSFDRAIYIDPKLAAARSNRGLAWLKRGISTKEKWNFDEAINDQKKAIDIDGSLAQAYYIRANAVVAKYAVDNKPVDQKEAGGVMADLEKAIQLKPGYADALCDRAKLYAFVAKDYDKAMADLDAAAKANPRSSLPRVQKGLVYMVAKKPEMALENFQAAVELNEHDSEAQCGLGYAMQATKNHEGAVKAFSRAIEIDPKLEMAYKGRSESYRKLGKAKEEKEDLAKMKELHPAPPAKTDKKKPDQQHQLPDRFMVKSTPVSPSKKGDAIRSAKEIDRLVELNYAKTNTKPNEMTTDAQFVRRIYLDITGTIPNYAQVQRFFSSTDSDKRSKLIDDLLNSDAYAGQQFLYWADVLRYTDYLSEDCRGEPYRQWLKQSLAENKPWDKIVHEILTAEGLVWQNPPAGYFLRDKNMPLDNMNNTVRIFLGTRIGCAQCHDHPFDRWTQKEFYQVAAFTFGTVPNTGGGDKRYWEKDPNERLRHEYEQIEQEEEDRRNNSYTFDRIMRVNMMVVNDRADRKIHLPKDYKYKDAKPGDVVEPKSLFGPPADLRPGETPRQAFARWSVSKENPRFALTISNRLWKQAFGIGQIEPVDDMMDQTVAENPDLMKFLESEMKRLDFDMKEYFRVIYNSATYQRQACADEIPIGEPYHFPGPALRRMTAEQVWDSFLTLAVVEPDEYREMPFHLRSDIMGMDLSTVSAADLMASEKKVGEVESSQSKRRQKYIYKGVLLGRASELPSPVAPNHFLRMFGQSDRELIAMSSTNGSVPQVLFMFNGPITHMLLEQNSTIYNVVIKKKTDPDRVKAIFMTILNREPDAEELQLGMNEIKKNGRAGCGNIIWSLVNTREFLFIQ